MNLKIDQLIRTNRKTIALIVKRDGRLIVRAPHQVSDEQILAFMEKKAHWIRAKQEMMRETYPKTAPRSFAAGESFWFLGKTYRLEIVEKVRQPLALDGVFLLDRAALPRAEAVFKKWYQVQARRVISERAAWYAEKFGFSYKDIKITSAQTRWGSCSTRNTLSFSWRLVMAPLAVVDYVVIHELVHTLEKNHKQGFWGKLKAILPDYRQKVEWLEANGHLLSLRGSI